MFDIKPFREEVLDILKEVVDSILRYGNYYQSDLKKYKMFL